MGQSRAKLEKELEARLIIEVERLGGKCLKLEVKGDRGWPDRLCVMPHGVVVFAELKRPDGKGHVARLQIEKIKTLGRLNQHVVLVASWPQLETFIEGLELEIMAAKARRERLERWTYDIDSRDGHPV